VLPAALHAGEVAGLFTLLAGAPAAAVITPSLAALAWPWFATLMAAAAAEARRDSVTGIELATLGALATAAPPLVAFAVFFCAMHGARHILRTAAYASDLRPRVLVAVAVAPMVIVLAVAAACWLLLSRVQVDARILQILFVGLAALTVPHMLLVERVRLSGWAPAA
jgi:Brp/Blh family beta-carotene 15,15'-monooxygenase